MRVRSVGISDALKTEAGIALAAAPWLRKDSSRSIVSVEPHASPVEQTSPSPVQMETAPSSTAPVSNSTSAGMTGRVFAFIGAVVLILVGSLFSLGATLLGPIAMAVGSHVWRQRGRTLSALGHWVAALCGATIVAVFFGALFASIIPKGSLADARKAADSAQKATAKEPPPAWLERIAPGAAARRATTPLSERAQTFNLALGAAFAMAFFIGFFGTIGWVCGMLIGFGVNGHWPGRSLT